MIRKVSPSLFSQLIAAQLRAQMAKMQLTQTEVAEHSGISQSQLLKFLRGARVLDVDQLEALCQVIDLDISAVVKTAWGQAVNRVDFEDFPALVSDGVRVENGATTTEIMQPSPEEPTPLIAVVTPPHGIPLQGQRAAKKAPKGWRDETDQ